MAGAEPVFELPADCPKPILPKQLIKSADPSRPISMHWSKASASPLKGEEQFVSRLKLIDLDPLEAARQLTLIEFDLFSKIKV